MVNTNEFVKDDLQGDCAYCKKKYPIGDGLNFALIKGNWVCRECESQGVWA